MAANAPHPVSRKKQKVFTIEAKGNWYDLMREDVTPSRIAEAFRDAVDAQIQLDKWHLELLTYRNRGNHEMAGTICAKMGDLRNHKHWLEGFVEAAKKLAQSLAGTKDE